MTRQLTKWIGDLAVTTAKLANNAVTSAKIATSAIGSGLAGGGGSPVSLNIDGLTNESSVDSVNDYAAFYDASAGAVRKTAIENIGGGGGGTSRLYPPGYLYGFPTVNNASNPTYQLDVGPGSCRSSDDTTDLTLTGTLTVDITVSGVNGLDTGSEATWTWYHLYLIYNPTTFSYGLLLSISATSPGLPGGYTKFRRLGCVINDGSGNFRLIRCQYRLGRERVFVYNDTNENDVQLLSAGSATTWTNLYTGASIPLTSLLGIFLFRFSALNYDWKCFLRPGDCTENEPPTCIYAGAATISALATSSLGIEMRTSSTRYIQYRIASAGGELSVWVLGYIDFV
jgi:hypothetical protein